MKYRICVLPDHPDVQEKTGDNNFMSKLTKHQDGKLHRFKEDNELENIISNADDNYSTGQGSTDPFTSLRPRSGFSEAVLFLIQGRPFLACPFFVSSVHRSVDPGYSL